MIIKKKMGKTPLKQRILLLLFCILGTSGPLLAGVNFKNIPIATSVEESKIYLNERIEEVLQRYSYDKMIPFPTGGSQSTIFLKTAIMSLRDGREIDFINQEILKPTSVPFSGGNPGTGITIIKGICEREGGYNFFSEYVLMLAYLYKDRPDLLWPQTLKKMQDVLLPIRGNKHYSKFSLGMCGMHRDTENHILTTEAVRYLTNQLLNKDPQHQNNPLYDNSKNGFNEWIVKHLQQFLKRGFAEYNSRPYAEISVGALNMLYSFAENPKVVLAAEMVLDYLAAHFAIHSNGLRRFPPFRRKPSYYDDTNSYRGDGEVARFAMLAGNYKYLEAPHLNFKLPYGDMHIYNAALTKYRVPDMLLDLMIEKGHNTYTQRAKYDNTESISSSKSYLISSGGVFDHHFKFFNKEQHGWARPTVLIPTEDNTADFTHLIRFAGHVERMKRANTCVTKNFACGFDLRIPSNIPQSCQEKKGDWIFFNFTSPDCPLKYNFHVAMMAKKCGTKKCHEASRDQYGLMEVREASEISFNQFKALVWNANYKKHYSWGKTGEYITTEGRKIQFNFYPRKGWYSSIISIDCVKQEENLKKWKLAEGDIMNASGDGLITVDNPYLKQRLILDLRDHLNPRKYYVTLPLEKDQ